MTDTCMKLEEEPKLFDVRAEVSKLEIRFPLLKKIVTNDIQLLELKYKTAQIAGLNVDALILGETGTGKELFARVIHQASGREGNFVPINCGAIPKDLLESELFGHKKAAFTGAICDNVGAFEYANKGTLFLDEIGEMPLAAQAKILRAVEYRVINRVGDVRPTKLDIKIVFATNKDLKTEVEKGNFRKDLYFRIFSPSFRILPLRERPEDIPILADHFLKMFNKKFQKQVGEISHSLIGKLRHNDFSGNVREFMKMIEMGLINCEGPVMHSKEIPYLDNGDEVHPNALPESAPPPATKITDNEIIFWMEQLNYNKSKVAKRLGVTYRTILRRWKNLNPQFSERKATP